MTSFAPHFPLAEFQAKSDRALTPTQQEFAAQLSQRLELLRHALGDQPLVITSFLRSDSGTQHAEGTAVDFRRPANVSWQRLTDVALALQHVGFHWGQLIPRYENDAHAHISLPTGQARQAILVETSAGTLVPLTPELYATLPDGVRGAAQAITAAAVVAGIVAAAAAMRALDRDRRAG